MGCRVASHPNKAAEGVAVAAGISEEDRGNGSEGHVESEGSRSSSSRPDSSAGSKERKAGLRAVRLGFRV